MMTRAQALEAAQDGTYDALIVGGGVTGAAVFRELGRRGYRVLLVDRGDFTAGTSQASGMLIWGGLLYLKNLDLRTVFKLSVARDELLRSESDDVRKLRFRYLPLLAGGRSSLLVRAALYAYWLMGGRRRQRPYAEELYPCAGLLQPGRFGRSLVYEEGSLTSSDSRFALGWITGGQDQHRVAINHCAAEEARWNRNGSLWEFELEDRLSGKRVRARTKTLINAAGVWADRVNDLCGLECDYRHVFSKGVYLAFRRPPELDEALVFEMRQHGDSQTFTPWGPVALWGPTESSVTRLEDGLAPTVADVRFLLDQANSNLREQRGPEDIVSLRCGIRPLAVKRGFRGSEYPLTLSRRHVVACDRKTAALTLYGGKLTSAHLLASEAADTLERHTAPRLQAVECGSAWGREDPSLLIETRFPGVEELLPDPAWCVRNEGCASLEDYLRRRTNLAQWIPRLGLGVGDENEQHIRRIAHAIHRAEDPLASADGHHERARDAVERLRRQALEQAELLASV